MLLSRRYLKDLPVVAISAAAVVLLMALLTPIVPAGVSEMLMSAYAFVCHQMPARSPVIDGTQVAVCYRCLGIYSGLIVGAFVYPPILSHMQLLMRRAGPIILASLAVPGIDWLGDVAGLWTNTPASRIITGAVFGITAGVYFAHATAELMHRQKTRQPVDVD